MSDRGRSRSRSRSPGGRGRGGGRRRDGISVLVRNLPLDTRPEEVRDLFDRYGRVNDVYLPKDYQTGRPKGFGFVELANDDDADEAIYQLDRRTFGGRELTVCRAREGRKRPEQMRSKEGSHRDGGRRHNRGRRSRSRDRSRSRGRRSRTRSRSPRRSPPTRSRSRSRDRSRSPLAAAGARDRSASPRRSRSPEPVRARSRSRSPQNGGGEEKQPGQSFEDVQQ